MKRTNNSLTITLMTSSIALMLVLEIFWLRSAFRDEFAQLKREANFIFQTTVFALQDSLIQKNITPVGSDSFNVKSEAHINRARIFVDTKLKRDSGVHDVANNIQIYVSGTGNTDSLKNIFFYRPLFKELRKDGTQKKFTIRLGADSIKRKDIEINLKKALIKADIDLTFEIEKIKPGSRRINTITGFATDLVPPGVPYVASFNEVQFLIFKKIAPQILFSFFLSCLTIVSFIFMYRSIRSQQRLMELKNDFVSNITHELKTPIATVSVALEALKNFNGIDNPVRTREYLDIAQHELNRLTILTDKVLNTSIFEEKGVSLELEKINLEGTIQEILNSMKLVIEKQGASVEFEKTGSDFIVEGSIVHLSNVIYNLFDNALKYSSAKPVISIAIKDIGDQVSFSISDQGCGIPERFHRKIFEKFFRMPTGDVHTIKGYGLGLSYVEGVVNAHHGSIAVKSESGKGSTFTVTLFKKINR